MAVSYAEIPELPTLWLWDRRIPRGDVTLLFGEGAVGKGRMLCDLIARVTIGAPMPLCAEGSEPGSVIVIQPEDDPNEQVAPRVRRRPDPGVRPDPAGRRHAVQAVRRHQA